jgi:2-polyprenyl-3-methyl-5-hydroxy-6-metoxy-1,4-benzoquinol methylase
VASKVLGVDVAETALAIAREKANDRGIEVEFTAADAFQLERDRIQTRYHDDGAPGWFATIKRT